ncbi:MAG: hypothetical protein ABI339_03210 [Solirubrobacteraceae bacterium]
MQPDEARALGDLAGSAAAGLATQVREVHEGVAGRVFGLSASRPHPCGPCMTASLEPPTPPPGR